MTHSVLITGAGSATANNLMRSLRALDPAPFIVGCHTDRFILKKSPADRNYVLPAATDARFAEALRGVTVRERIALAIPTTDFDVSLLVRLADELPCRLFLPASATIDLCQDKYELTAFLRARGLPAPATEAVTDLAAVPEVFGRLAPPIPLWCRTRTGTCSMGATPVKTAEQARAWIEYWQEMREVPAGAFTLSEYLPGRDFACQSLWKDGQPILTKTFERLSYVGGATRPSGVSSIAAVAKTVDEPDVAEVCRRVIRAVDPRASGIFSVDLKGDAAGAPRVTEINAGRFFTMMNLFDFCGKHSMTGTYVRLALGEDVNLRDEYDAVEDYYVVRDVDTVPDIFHADELFDGVEEDHYAE